MLASWLAWLGDTSSSIALRESIWAYPIVETAHVLGLALFAGLAMLLDLRLTGFVLPRLPVQELVERVGRWTWTGFAVMVVSGVLLFYADPVKMAFNPFFRAKLALLVVAGVNAVIFHVTVYRRVAEWGAASLTPRPARAAGWISLAVWIAVIATGRLIAFYQPAIVP
jgi:hypothetical protein